MSINSHFEKHPIPPEGGLEIILLKANFSILGVFTL
jgi:hypothetical protein